MFPLFFFAWQDRVSQCGGDEPETATHGEQGAVSHGWAGLNHAANQF